MENVLKLVLRIDAVTEKEDKSKKKLLCDIKEVSRLIACNERWFDLEIDDNLIDACIYERQSLFSRYRYLMNLAKKSGLNCNPLENNSMGV